VGVIVQEGGPGLPGVRGTRRAHILLDRPFGDPDIQLEKFTADALGAPEPVVAGHLLDQRDRLGGDLRTLAGRG
jgi:hypothetical protein